MFVHRDTDVLRKLTHEVGVVVDQGDGEEIGFVVVGVVVGPGYREEAWRVGCGIWMGEVEDVAGAGGGYF